MIAILCFVSLLGQFVSSQEAPVKFGNASDCFTRFGNCDIDFYAPYRRVWRVPDEPSCIAACGVGAENGKCVSAVYDVRQEICNLFDQDGTVEPAFLLPAFKKVFYKVTDEECLAKYKGATQPAPGPDGPPPCVNEFEPDPLGGICPDDELPAFLQFPNSVQFETGICPQVLDGSDLGTCQFACEANTGFAGEPYPCWGFSYDKDNNECSFHSTKLSPDGTSDIFDQEGSVTSIKFCFTELLLEIGLCEDVVMRGLRYEKLSDGFVRKTIALDVQSLYYGLRQCVFKCIIEAEFLCLSASYKADSFECDLRDENRATRPNDVVDNDNLDHYYWDNGCALVRRRQAVRAKTETQTRSPLLRRSRPAAVKSKTVKSKSDPRISTPRLRLPTQPSQVLLSDPRVSAVRLAPVDAVPTLHVWGDWSACQHIGELRVRARQRLCRAGSFGCPDDEFKLEECPFVEGIVKIS